jgi:hypothetical protein
MEKLPQVPGDYFLLYKVNIKSPDDFQEIKTQILELDGVEDVLLHQKISAYQLVLLTDGSVIDNEVKTIIQQLGYEATRHRLSLSK